MLFQLAVYYAYLIRGLSTSDVAFLQIRLAPLFLSYYQKCVIVT
jgi:hypothetical protein